MSYSQLDIDKEVDGVIGRYKGQRAGYFGSFVGESIVPVAYYIDRLRGTSPPPMPTNRIDEWGENFPSSLAPIFVHEKYKTGMVYPKGTLLIWDTPHIAIVTKSYGDNTIQVFEQNANPEGSVCAVKDRVIDGNGSTCTHALIPITEKVELPKEKTTGTAPAPPDRPKHTLPMGGLKLPVKKQRIYIRNTVLGFPSYTKASGHTDAVTTVAIGNYYVYRETEGMLNVSKEQNTPGYWINPKDNESYDRIKT